MREKWRGSLKDGEEWLMCILREGEIIWVFFFLVLLDIQELKTRNGLRNNKEMYGVDNIRSGLAYQDL